MKDNSFKAYLRGEKLYGDDFSLREIEQWFGDEKEGYANLGSKERLKYKYRYHALNRRHGFRYLPNRNFAHVVSWGGAYGDELIPIAASISKITIVEPSSQLYSRDIDGVKTTYMGPRIDGTIPFYNSQADLITCFGTLHHIPNVSRVMLEIYRCLKPGGYALIREPICSMGNWLERRKGLTKHERGIPLNLFRNIIFKSGFQIVKETKCMFSLTSRLGLIFKNPVYNNDLLVSLDQLISTLFSWNNTYHAKVFVQKLRPTSVFYVLYKPKRSAVVPRSP